MEQLEDAMDEIANKDAEIARLRAELAKKSPRSSPSPVMPNIRHAEKRILTACVRVCMKKSPEQRRKKEEEKKQAEARTAEMQAEIDRLRAQNDATVVCAS